MRAVRCSEKGVQVLDLPPPDGEGVRVRVASAGICGSDLHLVEGSFAMGRTLGHEIAGELPDGRRVAIEPIDPCGHCDPCLGGDYNLCERGAGMLLGVGLDGGMADELLAPTRSLVTLPSGLDLRDACLVEPLAVAAHGLRLAGVGHGSGGPGRLAVVGGGSIGLCALAMARAWGAEVGLAARHPHQQEAGNRLGARELESRYPLVVDAAGSESALAQAVELCQPGGTVLLLATYWDGKLALPSFDVTLREIRILPSSLYSADGDRRDVDAAAAALAGNAAIAQTLITHRFPLDAAAEAFEVARSRASGSIKVVLEP